MRENVDQMSEKNILRDNPEHSGVCIKRLNGLLMERVWRGFGWDLREASKTQTMKRWQQMSQRRPVHTCLANCHFLLILNDNLSVYSLLHQLKMSHGRKREWLSLEKEWWLQAEGEWTRVQQEEKHEKAGVKLRSAENEVEEKWASNKNMGFNTGMPAFVSK